MGGVQGLAATSPSVTHETLAHDKYAQRGRQPVREPQDLGAQLADSRSRARGQHRLPVHDRVRRRVGHRSANSSPACSRFPASQRCRRTRSSSRKTTTRRSSARRTSGRRSAGPDTPARTSSSASSTPASGRSTRSLRRPRPAGAAAAASYACQFGDGSDAAHLGPTFACNNKLIGAYAFTDTYMALIGTERPASSATTRRSMCSARDSEGHGTHTDDDRRRRLRRLGDALRRRARPGLRHRPRRPRDRCTASASAAAASAPTPWRPCSRRSSTASTSSTSRSRAARNPYTDPVELAFLDAYERRDLGQRVGRQQRPGRGDVRARRPVGDDGRRLDGPASVHLDAAPDGRRRRDARRSGRHAHQRHLVGDAGRPRRDAPRRRGRGRALPVERSPRARPPARSWSAQRGVERPHRQGLQRPARAARPG